MKEELKQLIALQNAEISIRQLQKEIDGTPLRRAEIEKEFDQRAFQIKEIQNRRDTAKKERSQLEFELAEQKTRAERADRNLMSSKNEHEYTAAIREADAARKQISQLETEILERMETVDKAELELKEREPELATLSSELEVKLKEIDDKTRTLQEDLARYTAEHERMLELLPKSTSALFKRIASRIRDGIAVAEAKNGSCTACFMSLRPQVMAEIRRGETIVQCDSCSRILYFSSGKQNAPDALPTSVTPNAAVS